VSDRLVEVSPELRALAQKGGDQSQHRAREPYRQALIGIYARVAATVQRLHGIADARHPNLDAAPYATAAELRADLGIIDQSLKANGSKILADGRLRILLRAVDCFGFHLTSTDLRQNSAVHEKVVHELLEAVQPGTNYLGRDEEGRIALLRSELATSRPLVSPFIDYSEQTRGELAVFRTAALAHQRLGAQVITTCIISKAEGISDMLELAILLK